MKGAARQVAALRQRQVRESPAEYDVGAAVDE